MSLILWYPWVLMIVGFVMFMAGISIAFYDVLSGFVFMTFGSVLCSIGDILNNYFREE